MTFTYRAPWIHWPIVATLWVAGLTAAILFAIWSLFALEIDRGSDIEIRVVVGLIEASLGALVAVLTIRCLGLADRFHTGRPIVLAEDGFGFVAVNGIERRVRWADVKSMTEDFRTDTIIIVFKRQVASEIDRCRRSDEWVRFSKDRIAPSGEVFVVQAQRLMATATASLPKDRHAKYAYRVR